MTKSEIQNAIKVMQAYLNGEQIESSNGYGWKVVIMPSFNFSSTQYRVKENKMSEQSIEKEIQEKGLNAPRLTPELIDSVITLEDYYVFPNSMMTVCCLTLKNGFNVVGESACVSPENFNEEIGRKIARDSARNKIWELEGYLLKEKLFRGTLE